MGSRRRQAQLVTAFAGGGIPAVRTHIHRRISAPLRWLRAARTHPIQTFAAVLFLYLWNAWGNLLLAALGSAALTGAGVYVWFDYRRRRTGLTVHQAATQLRLQNRVKDRWGKACFAAGITANAMGRAGKTGVVIPPLTKISTDKGDVTARVYAGQYAIATKQVAGALERVADTVGCNEVTMRNVSPGVNDLRFCFTNPLEKIVKPTDIRVAPKGTIPFGVTETGEPITIPVLNTDGESEFRSTL